MNNTKTLKQKYIGDKAFYVMVLTIAIPIMLQNGISNFVNMLDNLMIGQLGTNALSGVAIANQFIFIYYLVMFGAEAGIGIFTAQYHGQKNVEGVRYSFRVKLFFLTIMAALVMTIFGLFSTELISLFLQGEGSAEDIEATLSIGREYMYIMLIGLIPNAWTCCYAGTLRETGYTKMPMFASMAAVFVNLIGNYLLIYGKLGLPELGARGAATATVISRFVELLILVIYTAKRADLHAWIKGAFSSMYVPGDLIGKFIIKSVPLMLNETLWSIGTTFMNQCYSYRSLDAVAAINIESALWNLCGVAFLAMGDAVGILAGHALGEGDIDKARDTVGKLIVFSVFCGTIFGLMMCALSPFFPMLYNTSEAIKSMATKLIIVVGILMPFCAFTHASYFTIRAGGRTGITFIFDSCFVWFLSVPTAYFISRYTTIPVVTMLAMVQSLEIIKCVIGGLMVKSGIWARVIVD